jgi:hypothetical protein
MGELLEGSAEDLLATSIRIHIGGVKEVDTRLNGVADQQLAGFLIERPAGISSGRITEAHTTDANRGNVETCATELYVLHLTSDLR